MTRDLRGARQRTFISAREIVLAAGHFSLVAAAPLAVFLLVLLRAARRERWQDALTLGACVWWATSTDVYYAVYCLMIAAAHFTARTVTIERRAAASNRGVTAGLNVLTFCTAALVLAIGISGGWQFTFLGRGVYMRTFYTPMLVLTVLVVLRVAWGVHLVLAPIRAADVWRVIRVAAVAACVAVFMLSPVLYALGERIAYAGFEPSRIFWRSSPAGVDLLALLLPNPNHPLAPALGQRWLSQTRDGYVESVASLSFVALAVIVWAWRAGWTLPRFWTWLTVAFGALALGPFVHAGGMNTFIPGPWALLRYVPVIGLARMPSRLSVVFMLGIAVLFAGALSALGRRWPHRRPALLVGVAVLLLFELLPAPRPLYLATIPTIYAQVAAAPDHVRVLELPFGVRDGTSSAGNFTARSQFFQTFHGQPLIGGYLSRVSTRRKAAIRADPMLAHLMLLSEGRPSSGLREQRLIEDGAQFVARSSVGSVVVDRARASDALVAFATRALALERIGSDRGFELYRPAADRDGPTQLAVPPADRFASPAAPAPSWR